MIIVIENKQVKNRKDYEKYSEDAKRHTEKRVKELAEQKFLAEQKRIEARKIKEEQKKEDTRLKEEKAKQKRQIMNNVNYLVENRDIPLHLRRAGIYCPSCNKASCDPFILNLKAYDMINKEFVGHEEFVYICEDCGRCHLDRLGYYNDCKRYIFFHNIFDEHGKIVATNDIDGFKERLLNEEEIVSFSLDLDSKSLIRVSDNYCTTDSHQLRDIEGIVNVMDTSGSVIEVRIPVGKCIACNKYYVHEREYKKLKSLGLILCRIADNKMQYGIMDRNFSEWNQESIIHMYGYNVSSTTNLSEEQRHTILKMLVSRKILSRFSIISHLEFLINLNKEKTGFAMAVKKWENDIDFIKTISIEAQTEEVEEIKIVKFLNWMHK